jgi:hypothetical protein
LISGIAKLSAAEDSAFANPAPDASSKSPRLLSTGCSLEKIEVYYCIFWKISNVAPADLKNKCNISTSISEYTVVII